MSSEADSNVNRTLRAMIEAAGAKRSGCFTVSPELLRLLEAYLASRMGEGWPGPASDGGLTVLECPVFAEADEKGWSFRPWR